MFAAGKLMGLARGGAAATVTATDAKVSTSNAASYSFASTNLGTPSADRYIVVVASCRTSGRTITACTVAGAAATLLTRVSASGDLTIYITNAVNSVDSTGTVVLTITGGNAGNAGISVYAVTGLNSNAADGTPQTTTTSGATMSLPVSAGGVGIGGSFTSQGTAPNFTWSGLTEDVDQLVESGNGVEGSASLASASAQTLSVISTATDTTDFSACCVALR